MSLKTILTDLLNTNPANITRSLTTSHTRNHLLHHPNVRSILPKIGIIVITIAIVKVIRVIVIVKEVSQIIATEVDQVIAILMYQKTIRGNGMSYRLT